MAKFKFSYEKLLEHTRLQEQIARRDYTESLGKLEAEKKTYNKMWEDMDAASDDLYSSRTNPKGIPIAKLEQLTGFIDGQKVRITRQREVVINHTGIVEQKQEILIAARKETKTLEKLKEKQLVDFKKLQKKLEAKATDELVVTRFRAGERE
jgi:flagellar protein FliJ